MKEQLSFPVVAIVVELAGPGILRCWRLVPGFLLGLCLFGVVVKSVKGHCRVLPLGYSQYMEQWQVVGKSEVVMVVVHIVLLLVILQS